MIVACSGCSARFRVADEKVGPRGARIRCSRCGQTFAVAPPPPPAPVAPPEPPIGSRFPEPTPPHTTSDATGGWPTGVLEIPGASDAGTPTATSLQGDPFAAFGGPVDSPPPEPTPVGLGLQGTAPRQDERSGFHGSLPVTSLADLERTGAVPLTGAAQPDPEFTLGSLALEERTPAAMPLRDGAPRWDDPEATNAVAIGQDGFQEVDLAASGAPPDPEFNPIDPEPVPPPPPAWPAPPEAPPPTPTQAASPAAAASSVSGAASAASVAAAAAAPAATAPGPAAASPPHSRRGFRVLAMNVLSLAALLVVTAGILVWWRGEGIGAGLRWAGGSDRQDLEVGQVSSGLYEGARGRQVLFVRGVVRATRGPVQGPVSVRVELVRGGERLGGGTALAGAVPGPEELAGVSSSEDLERLAAATASRAPPRLEPGEDVPFLAVLPAPGGDIGAIRYRVEPVPAAGR